MPTPAQQLMIEDGLPAAAIVEDKERKAAWKGRKLRPTSTFAAKPAAKDEDPATKQLRKEIAAADAKKKAERFARLKELNQQKRKATPMTKKTSKTDQIKALRVKKAANGKKPHPADTAALAGIASAVHFEVHLFKNKATTKVENIPTLAEARAKAAEMAVGASRRPGVYAIGPDGSAHLVPADYGKESPPKPAKAAKPPKAPKPAKAAKAAKAAKEGPSKTEIAIKLLSRDKGASRKEIIEATEWPSINLKAIAKRRKMKLSEKDGVLHLA